MSTTLPAGASWASNVRVVGYHDLDDRPAFKIALQRTADRWYVTYFGAGLRIIDIADPRLPREVGSFVPPDPTVRRGVLPRTLVAQSEDVLVDARGMIYLTDKNHGLYILEHVP